MSFKRPSADDLLNAYDELEAIFLEPDGDKRLHRPDIPAWIDKFHRILASRNFQPAQSLYVFRDEGMITYLGRRQSIIDKYHYVEPEYEHQNTHPGVIPDAYAKYLVRVKSLFGSPITLLSMHADQGDLCGPPYWILRPGRHASFDDTNDILCAQVFNHFKRNSEARNCFCTRWGLMANSSVADLREPLREAAADMSAAVLDAFVQEDGTAKPHRNVLYVPLFHERNLMFQVAYGFAHIPDWATARITETLCTKFIQSLYMDVREYQAVRSATRTIATQVFARNLSHNLGSNAAWHIVRAIETVGPCGYSQDPLSKAISATEHGTLVTAAEVASFLKYMKDRALFITSVASGATTWSLAMPWSTAMQSFTAHNSDVLRLLAIGTGQEWSHSEGTPRPPQYVNPANGTWETEAVSFPLGALGLHALYSILENIFRNEIRHSYHASTSGPVLKVGLHRAISKSDEELSETKKRIERDFYRVTVESTLVTHPTALSNVTQDLKSVLIDPATLKTGRADWGMKEIRLSAAVLRGIPFGEIDSSPGEEPPLVDVEQLEKPSVLKYAFYVLRPKLAAIVVSSSDMLRTKENALQELGIDVFTLAQLIDLTSRGIFPRHDFLVLDEADPAIMEWCEEHRVSLPQRKVELSRGIRRSLSSTQTDVGLKDSLEKITLQLWEKWRQTRFGDWRLAVRPRAGGVGGDYSGTLKWVRGIAKCTDLKRVARWVNHTALYDHDIDIDGQGWHCLLQLGNRTPEFMSEPTEPPEFADILRYPGSFEWKVALYKALEAASVRVLIVDDRLYPSEMERRVPVKSRNLLLTLQDVWGKRRVDIEGAEATQSVGGLTNRLLTADSDHTNHKSVYDWIFLHSTLVLGSSADKSIPVVNKMVELLKEIETKGCRVVLHTDRGEDHRARERGLHWTDYTSIADIITKPQAKMTLIHQAMALRFPT